MTPPTALLIDTIRVRYGDRIAVDGVSLTVNRGEVVGLLGPNGSGKSTTLAAAAGVIEPFSGTVSVGGVRRDQSPGQYARQVGLVPQEPALYDDLTAQANLDFFGRLYGLRGADLYRRVERGLEQSRLADRRKSRVSTFSGGMKQRLNLAVALLHGPPVILLDEPTAALDPASRDNLFSVLHDLREEGHAILLTTHHLDEAESGCDRLVVLDAGKVVATGRPADLIRARPAGRAVLYGHSREALPKFFQKGLRRRVGPGVELEFTGRRVRISAPSGEELGRALALILEDGVPLETFRTPPGHLEHLLRGVPATDAVPTAPAVAVPAESPRS